MKKLTIFLIILCGFILVPATRAQKGAKTLGVLTGYNTCNNAPLAGISFTYGFSDHFRLAPNARYVFRSKSKDAYILSVDAHFPFTLKTAKPMQLYPLAGLAFTTWNFHESKLDHITDDDVTTRKDSFGLNFGAGTNLNLTPTLRLCLEARYTLIRHNPSANISLGISYCF